MRWQEGLCNCMRTPEMLQPARAVQRAVAPHNGFGCFQLGFEDSNLRNCSPILSALTCTCQNPPRSASSAAISMLLCTTTVWILTRGQTELPYPAPHAALCRQSVGRPCEACTQPAALLCRCLQQNCLPPCHVLRRAMCGAGKSKEGYDSFMDTAWRNYYSARNAAGGCRLVWRSRV